ncbi:MAG: hypothetical protein BWX79_02107 [Alphaproteobacteria bacterium ADurb.Bin100]|nr:MAG: hypothetical protein BWX79_02107 [Alphaproteobacteria bacterium ADurb.Bin100]
MPPMMVAPLRLVPGIMARHCTSPTLRASSGVMLSRFWIRAALCGRFSAHRMMKPPMMKVLATTTGVNRCALIALPNSSPRMTAGMKAISTLTVKRCACRLVGRATIVSWIFFQYTMITARMAPVWIAMSKTLAFSSSKPNSAPARIRWPVDEIGRNSVKPSTTPITAALTSRTISTRAPEKSGDYRRPVTILTRSAAPGSATAWRPGVQDRNRRTRRQRPRTPPPGRSSSRSC